MDIEYEALRKNDSIGIFLEKQRKQLHVEQEFARELLDNFTILVVEADVRGILYNHKKPMSLKPGNVFVDVRGALKAAAEIFAGYQKPDSLLSGVQLMLLLIFSLKDVINVELPDRSAEILTILNRMGAYDRPVEEEVVMHKVLEFEKEHYLPLADEGKLMETMDFLGKYKVLDLSDGKVRLSEKVFGKDFA